MYRLASVLSSADLFAEFRDWTSASFNPSRGDDASIFIQVNRSCEPVIAVLFWICIASALVVNI